MNMTNLRTKASSLSDDLTSFGLAYSLITTIEQVMRSLKAHDGLSHGRGITDSRLVTCVATIPTIIEIAAQVEDFGSVTNGTSKQHVDARLLRVQRDDADVSILHNWFSFHYPS